MSSALLLGLSPQADLNEWRSRTQWKPHIKLTGAGGAFRGNLFPDGSHLPPGTGILPLDRACATVFCPFPSSTWNLCLCFLLGEQLEHWHYHSDRHRAMMLFVGGTGSGALCHRFRHWWFSCHALVSRNAWGVPEPKVSGASGLFLSEGWRKGGQTRSDLRSFFTFLKGVATSLATEVTFKLEETLLKDFVHVLAISWISEGVHRRNNAKAAALGQM